MPYKKLYKKSFRRKLKKRYRKKGKKVTEYKGIPSYLKNALMAMPSGGLPSTKMIRFRYQDERRFSNAAGVIQIDVFNANSLFDPLSDPDSSTVSGAQTNAQPLFRDQWATLYARYRVMYVRISCQFTNLAATAARLAVIPCAESLAAETDISSNLQRPQTKWTVCSSSDGDNNVVTVSQFLPVWEIVGATKEEYMSDVTYSAAQGASPANTIFYNIMCQAVDRSSTVSVNNLVTIDYITMLYEPNKNQSAS